MEGLGGRKIDDEIEFDRLLDRNVARLRAAQNLINVVAGAPELIRQVCVRFDVFLETVYRWQPRGSRQPSGKAGAAL